MSVVGIFRMGDITAPIHAPEPTTNDVDEGDES